MSAQQRKYSKHCLVLFAILLLSLNSIDVTAQVAPCDTFFVDTVGDSFSVITDPSTIYVSAETPSPRTIDAMCVTILTPGYYRIHVEVDYSDDQFNETFYLQIRYSDGTFAPMCDPNAGPYKVVPDTAVTPPIAFRNAGSFYFRQGVNTVVLNHYLLIQDQYPQFLDPPGSPIVIGGGIAESIHVSEVILVYKDMCRQAVDLNLSKTADEDTLLAGENLTYTLTTTNTSPHTAYDITLRDTLPDYVTASNFSLGPDLIEGSILTWNFDSLGAGEQLLVTFTGSVAEQLPYFPMALVNRALVEAPQDSALGNNYDDVTVVALKPPEPPKYYDLRLAKTASRDTVVAGGNFVYTLVINNDGQNTAYNYTLRDTLPEFVTSSSYSRAPDLIEDNVLVWNFDSLRVGDQVTITFSGTVASQLINPPLTLINTGFVHAPLDTILANNRAQATIVAVELPPPPKNYDLGISKTATTDTIQTGEQFAYGLTIDHLGPNTAYNVTVTDTLPAYITAQGFNPSPDSTFANILFWRFDSLLAGQRIELTFGATVNDTLPTSPFLLTNTCVLSAPNDTNAANNIARATVIAKEPPPPPPKCDLTVNKSANKDTVETAEQYQYTLSSVNLGPDTAYDIELTDALPDHITTSNFSVPPDSVDANILFWRFDSLLSGQSIDLTFTATVTDSLPTSPLSLLNTCVVSATNDTNSTNNIASATVIAKQAPTPPPLRNYDLIASKNATEDTVQTGGLYQYELAIGNLGPNTAYNVTLVDTLPAHITAADYSIVPDSTYANQLFWRFDSLTTGQAVRLTFTATVADSLPTTPLPLLNICAVSAPRDTNAANNRSSVTVIAIQGPTPPPPRNCDLSTSKNASKDTVETGEQYQYTLGIHNLGPHTAYNVTVVDTLPPYISPTSYNIEPDSTHANVLFWDLDSLPSDQTVNLTFTSTVAYSIPTSPLRLINTCAVSASNDTNAANNVSRAVVIAVEPPTPPYRNHDLSVVKHASRDTVQTGEDYSYELTITNLGPNTSYSIALRDTLPDHVIASDYNVKPDSSKANVLFWHFDSLATGQRAALSFTATVVDSLPTSPMELINTCIVSAPKDTNAANNVARATVLAFEGPIPPPKNYDLGVVKNANTDTVEAGGQYVYQITISHLGPNTAYNITLVDTLPDHITTSDFSVSPDSSENNILFWHFDSLTTGREIGLSFAATVNESLPTSPLALTNICMVDAPYDTNAANNVAQTTVVARRLPTPPPQYSDLEMSKDASKDTVQAGQQFTYQLTVENLGPNVAYNIVIADTLPDYIGTSGYNVEPTDVQNNVLVWHFDSLLVREEIGLSFTATVAASLPTSPLLLANTCAVTVPNDTNTVNNVAQVIVIAFEPPPQNYDIEATKTADRDTVFVSEEFEYQLNVHNLGPHTAYNLVLTDTLPPYVSVSDYTTYPDSVASNILYWRLESLAPDEHFTVTVVCRVAESLPSSPTTLTNICGVSATNDTTLDNNTARARVIAANVAADCNSYYFDQNAFEPDKGVPLTIFFGLQSTAVVRLDLYDITGYHVTKIVEDTFNVGLNKHLWNGKTDEGLDVGSGVYIIALRTGHLICWKKVIVIR